MKNKIQFWFSQLKFNPEKNYYSILNVKKNATQDEIKSSFYNLAKIYHPDKNPNQTDKFKAINEAYEILKSPNIRKEYDEFQVNPQQYQKKQYDRNSYQHQTYSYQQNSSQDSFRKVYEEYKQKNYYQQYQYQSRQNTEDNPFKGFHDHERETFDLSQKRTTLLRYLMLFTFGISAFIFFEIFNAFFDQKTVVIFDQATGQQYMTTQAELRRIQSAQMNPQRQRETDRQMREYHLEQQEEIRRRRRQQQILNNQNVNSEFYK